MTPFRSFATVRDRIYADFLMPSRLESYRRLLDVAIQAGYAVISVEAYWQSVSRQTIDPEARYLILRHDVDTDPGTAAQMWQLERELGIEGSYFFRLSTLEIDLMNRIAESGSRVSYHYEELATVAKQRRPAGMSAALRLVPEAQDLFARNIGNLRRRTGLPMDVVASHGDFVNRRIGINNTKILDDETFRQEMRITLETYDAVFLDTVTSYHRDLPPPARWMHDDPFVSVARRDPIMYVLIHPRPWQVNRRVNAIDDLNRLREGLAYRLPTRSRSGTG